MFVLALVNSKAGTGKSTLAVNLAVAIKSDTRRVAIVDLDPQQSAATWWTLGGNRTDVRVLKSPGGDLGDVIDGLESGAAYDDPDCVAPDVLIVDTPGGFLRQMGRTAARVDFALVPMRPGVFDLDSARAGLTVLRNARVPYAIAINDAVRGERFAKEIHDALAEAGEPVLDVIVAHRGAYMSSIADGKGAVELQGGKSAKDELLALWQNIQAAVAAAKKKGGRK